jgi:cytochrome c553
MQKMLAVLALSGLAVSASAADIEAGKAKAASCAGCHGADGIAVNPAYPNLAGQNAQYLVAAIKAYKDGTRNNPVMGALVKALSDEDIENIAAYYQSLKK